MVRGLEQFRLHFAGDTEGYVLIGGVAASLLMEEAGLTFRATKDLDIVLVVGRTELDGLRLAQADRLIPLKASAWLDLGERAARGEKIDSKDIRKHLADVFRLFPLLGGQARVTLPPGMAARFGAFLARARGEVVDLKAMGVQGGTQQGILDQLAVIYGN